MLYKRNNDSYGPRRFKDDSLFSNKYDFKTNSNLNFRFEKEINNESIQLIKSPSMASITMDNNEKKKTAEFEGEDLTPSQPIEKYQLNSKPLGLNKSNILNSQNLSREDPRLNYPRRNGLGNLDNLQ